MFVAVNGKRDLTKAESRVPAEVGVGIATEWAEYQVS